MARPKKAVVDYFPHSISQGKTIFMLESRFGNDGYAFWFKLLEMLGAAPHHFLDCNDPAVWEFMLAKTRVNESDANNILELCAKVGAINPELWKFKVVRSDNFINNLDGVYQRRDVKPIGNTDLLDLCQQKLPLSGVIVNINPQSKVKESKVKNKNILVNDGVVAPPDCPHSKIIDLYHEALPELPRISTVIKNGQQVYNWNGDREKMLKSRWRESERRQNLDWWRGYFQRVRQSDFLMGKKDPAPGHTVFQANLGWLIKPSNFNKVVEHGYIDR